MRIAQFVPYISADGAYGGPVAVALAQCEALAALGHTVHLYAGWDGIARIRVEGVTVRLFRSRFLVKKQLWSVWTTRLLLTLFRQASQFDAVHIHGGRELIALSAHCVARRRQQNVFLQTHGMVMPDPRPRARVVDALGTRAMLRASTTVFVLTASESDGLSQISCGLHTTRVPNGVAVHAGASSARSNRKVVFIARLHQRKRVMTFASAARMVSAHVPSAQFDVYGPDEGDLATLETFITENRLGEHVRYRGVLAPGESLDVLRDAAIFVLPSVGEVYPMTVLEAMSVGAAVVMTSDCGIAPQLKAADAAAVVSPDAPAVAAAIEAWLQDDAQRAGVGSRALDLVRSQMSSRAVALQLSKAYEKQTREEFI